MVPIFADMVGISPVTGLGVAIRIRRESAGFYPKEPKQINDIFLRAAKGEFDAVVALYHDQATIAVKSLAFGSAVNVTLGLPVSRCPT